MSRPPRWQNGSTRRWRNLRAFVLERDGHRCTAVDAASGDRCGNSEWLEVHHLFDGDPQIVEAWRLRTVCRTCHDLASFQGAELGFVELAYQAA